MPGTICIFGAGAIGCYVGGRLAAAGASVQFVGRQRTARDVEEHGLELVDLAGRVTRVPAAEVRYATSPDPASEADLVLVAVKSAGTEEAARQLADRVKPGAVIVSLQNGTGNADKLAAVLRDNEVLAGMVPFNVVKPAPGRFQQATEGDLEIEASESLAPFLPAFERAGLPLHQRTDMRAVLWAKLVLNLNNAINALSNVPLKEELSQRSFRRCLAMAQTELLALLRAAGIEPARVTSVPTNLLPRLLTLPDWLFRALASKVLAIDPAARSSMWDDLELGRKTEIDWLNGEAVRLASELGRRAPVNQRLVELIREAEAGNRRTFTGDELLDELRRARA